MRVVIVVAALVALTGCKSTAERAAEDDGYCQSLGAPVGSTPYVQCRLVQQQRRDARRQAAADAIGSIGENIQRNQAIANANRPLNCTSRTVAGTTNTTCY